MITRESKIKSLMKELKSLVNGNISEYTTSNSLGRSSKKIVLEYDVKEKE